MISGDDEKLSRQIRDKREAAEREKARTIADEAAATSGRFAWDSYKARNAARDTRAAAGMGFWRLALFVAVGIIIADLIRWLAVWIIGSVARTP
jgi:hypothetical protein